MAVTQSAGIVLVRQCEEHEPEILLVHPGGPFWASKDAGAWSIPKGEPAPDEDLLAAAVREFREELGLECPAPELIPLGEITQRAGKRVSAWCGVGEIDTSAAVSNTFEMIWPPKSGRTQAFPEVDRVEYFSLAVAREKVLEAQVPLLELAVREVAARGWIRA